MVKIDVKTKATRTINSGRRKGVEIIVDSTVIEEDLPFRFVHYPSLYGIFIGFSETESDSPYFCDCCKPSIKNYLELNDLANKNNRVSISEQLIKDFPRTLTAYSSRTETFPKLFQFRKQLCHRCNHATPQVRHCHHMYGNNFKQYFGWYIGQMQYRLGFNGSDFLEKQSPQEIKDLLIEFQNIKFPDLINNDPAKILTKYADACGTLNTLVENSAREEFGFRRIGETWINESVLFRQIQNIFPDKQILRHYRPPWLEGMEIDIFLPEINLGIEYQGQQHFHPIRAWGGKKSFEKLQERDARKKILCAQFGILLAEISYTEPITEGFIREKLFHQSIKINKH